ncbi:MAG: efflux RND transporter permease subunit [Epsilonproteobacteria bacterium]|nr:efflux RND transporter permease subunit [Campylobacterota bacterium]
MQNFIHFFIYHRSLTHLLFLFLLLVAYFSYLKVPKEMFPPNALDKILISGYYGSASNAVLDRLIVQECESLLKEHPFVSEISSMITGGSYQITGDITDGDKKEQVIAEIETGLKALKEDLPSDFILPAVKGVEQFFPLMSISLFTDKIHHDEAVEVGKRLSEAIKKFDHIYQSEVVGKYEKVLEMSIDDKLLMAYSIDRDSVYQTISSIYSLFPIGDLTSDNERYFISTKSEDITLDEIRDYQIRIDGKVIRVGDIITLKYRYERHALLTKTDGKKALMINVKKAKAGDSIKLSGQIRTLIESYETRYPHIGIKVLSDSSFWIRTRLNVISSNVIIGLLLLFSMIWFLISLKIALVVLIGIPVSFAFGIIGLDIFDSSLNTLSMIGVLLSLGLLVDEANDQLVANWKLLDDWLKTLHEFLCG